MDVKNKKRVMISYNRRDRNSVKIAEDICTELSAAGITPLSLKYDDGSSGGLSGAESSESGEGCLCMITVGGDGSIISHGKLAAALEDVAFLLLWAGALLCFSTVLARGEFRGYYVMGSVLGFLLYRCTLGCVTVPLLGRVLAGIFGSLRRLFRPLFHGVVRICTPLHRKFGHFAKLFRKASFFSHLPLQRDRKMLYNDSGILKRKAALSWQRKQKRKKSGHA